MKLGRYEDTPLQFRLSFLTEEVTQPGMSVLYIHEDLTWIPRIFGRGHGMSAREMVTPNHQAPGHQEGLSLKNDTQSWPLAFTCAHKFANIHIQTSKV